MKRRQRGEGAGGGKSEGKMGRGKALKEGALKL
jgi:hypothetical protein